MADVNSRRAGRVDFSALCAGGNIGTHSLNENGFLWLATQYGYMGLSCSVSDGVMYLGDFGSLMRYNLGLDDTPPIVAALQKIEK